MNETIVITLALKSSVLIVLAGLASTLLRRFSAGLRHWIWCLMFAGMAMLVVLPFVLPSWELPVLPREASWMNVSVASNPSMSNFAIAPGVTREISTKGGPWSAWAGVLWAAGFLLVCGRTLFDLWALRWIASTGELLPALMAKVAYRCRQRLGASNPLNVRLTDRVSVPMVGAALEPIVLLPMEAKSWSTDRLELVLLHELGHLRRYDHVTTLMVRFVCALYWANPLVWLAVRSLTLEREQACDELVLRAGARRIEYAEHLIAIARGLRPAPGRAGIAIVDRSGFRRRIQSVLHCQLRSAGHSRRMAFLSIAIVLMFFVPFGVAELGERETVVRLSEESFLTELLTDLEAGTFGQRRRAAWSLGERENPRAVEGLIQALSDGEPELRGLAAWALGEIKDPRAIAPLVSSLADEDIYAREMAVRALGEIEDSRAVDALLEALDDPSPAIRSAVIWSLGEIGDRTGLDAVAEAVEDPEPLVRQTAVKVLVGKAQACDPLRSALSDPELEVQREAVRHLGDVGQPGAVGPLMARLEDADPVVRREAARTLGKIGDSRAVDALIRALRDEDPEVRNWAVWALDEINPSRV